MNYSAPWNGTLLVTAAVFGLLGTAASLMPMFGGVLQPLVALALCLYSYDVLRAFAQGHRNISPPDIDSVSPVGRIPLLLHFIAFPGAIACARIYLPGGAVIGVLIAAAFPASAALMAVTGRLESAFNPIAIGRCITILGRDYVFVGGAALLAALAAVGVGALLEDGGLVPLAVSAMLESWLLLATFALTGAAVQAHRLDFDIPGELADPQERDLAERERAWRGVLDQAYASLRGGRPEAGYRALRQFLDANAESPRAHYWLLENLFDWEDKRHALGVAARLISAEIAQGRPGSAWDLYRRCRRVSDRFELPPADAAALAGYGRSIGQAGIASELQPGPVPSGEPAAGGLRYNSRSTKST